jgi:hypothetical protein
MTRDWSNRSFREMATSDGDTVREPYEVPLITTLARTDDRGTTNPGTGTYEQPNRQGTGQTQYRQPYEIPTQPQQTQTGGGQWRSPYGGVAPIATTIPVDGRQTQPQPQPTDGGQWRSPYGGVAPIAQNLPPIDGSQPTQSGNGQWRPDYNNPAPSARDLPPMDPNANGGVTAPGTDGPWRPSPNQIGPGVGPGGVLDQNPGLYPGGQRQGGDPIAITGNGGISPPTEQQRAAIENSLHTRLNYQTHYVEAALGGLAGATVLPWAGDKLFWNSRLDGNGVAEWWRRSHSPLGLQLRTHDGTIAELVQKGSDLNGPLTAAQQQHREAMREMIGSRAAGGNPSTGLRLIQDMQREAATGFKADPTNLGLGKKAQLLDDFMQSRPATQAEFAALRTRIDAARMVDDAAAMTETSYLKAAEAAELKNAMNRYGRTLQTADNLGTLKGAVQQNADEIAAATAARDGVRARGGDFGPTGGVKPWKDNIRPGAGKVETELTTWNGQSRLRAMAEGVGVVSAGLAATWLVDKYVPNMFGVVGGKDAKMEDHWRSYMQGPAIAAALLWPNKSTTWKVSAAVASTVAIGVAEKFFPEKNNGTYSKIMQPNWVDAVGMSAAWMMPFASWKNRAMAVGGAWALARGADFLNNVVGVPIPGIGDQNFAVGMNSDVASAIAENRVSSGNFNEIRSSAYKLGMENEGALLGHIGTFMNDRNHNPLYHLHGGAALFTALGDMQAERGTKLQQSQLNTDGRILAGTGYDLGGQATDLYRQSIANLVEGQNQARRAGDTASENAMKQSQEQVMERLNRIYGEHNIGDIFNKLKDAYKNDVSGIAHFQVQLKQKVSTLQTRDTQYAAKMCRDLAILDLAIASFKAERNEGGGATIMYNEAIQFLQAAERIQPNAPDAREIRKIAEQLRPSIPQAVNNQYNSTFNNPFRVGQTGTP